ncbi:hypothetical protein LTR85_001569 [Meristemomyces frigidus]|nr:hypothetical protein LTR85_001569 [Meristemomyces frigidus]
MAKTTFLSFISLALLLPSTIALPFDFNFFKGKAYEGPWQPQYHHHKPYATYTMTASGEGIYPPPPSSYGPTASSGYTAVTATGTGTGTAVYATGTGTAVYPTGTGYWKRDQDERRWDFPFPTGFPTGTGTGFSFPTSFPTSFPGGESYGAAPMEMGHFGGARKQHEHRYYPYAPASYSSEPTAPLPTATAPSFAAPTAPSYTASGW